MISVGVKELKAKLSSFIARAREGEEIVITDHGKDVALIMPLSQERRAVKSLTAQGKAKWRGETRRDDRYPHQGKGPFENRY